MKRLFEGPEARWGEKENEIHRKVREALEPVFKEYLDYNSRDIHYIFQAATEDLVTEYLLKLRSKNTKTRGPEMEVDSL